MATRKKTTKKTTSSRPAPAAKPKRAASAPKPDFEPVFARLKKMMGRHQKALVVKQDAPGRYYLCSPKPWNKRELTFGAVMTMKNYVSYHLVPVYMFPEILAGMPPELKKRMQGKGCFNFTVIDKPAFEALEALTQAGFEAFKRRELV